MNSQPVQVGELRIRPLQQQGFGGRAEPVGLSSDISDVLRRSIDEAMDRFAVLVFPGQQFDDDGQFAFAARFGPVENVNSRLYSRGRLDNGKVSDISNLDASGRIMAADDRHRMFLLGNLLWHSDSSFKPVPAKYSFLHARVIPDEGGDTEFADMRAAWDALPAKMKHKVRDLVCDHSLIYSRAASGFDAFSPEQLPLMTPVPQRMVRRHESTGRLSLFLSAHAGQIHGWQRPEAVALLNELTEFATQPAFVYRHRWQAGDLVIWDNRCTMHRGRPYDSHGQVRDLRRVTLQGSASTLAQMAAVP